MFPAFLSCLLSCILCYVLCAFLVRTSIFCLLFRINLSSAFVGFWIHLLLSSFCNYSPWEGLRTSAHWRASISAFGKLLNHSLWEGLCTSAHCRASILSFCWASSITAFEGGLVPLPIGASITAYVRGFVPQPIDGHLSQPNDRLQYSVFVRLQPQLGYNFQPWSGTASVGHPSSVVVRLQT